MTRVLLDFLWAEIWPPTAADEEAHQLASTPGQRGQMTRYVARVSSRRTVVALAAVGLVAGAGLRYAPRTWR